MSWPWSELGLSGPSDAGEVKRAYAQKVKAVHPEEDPDGFQQLYAAYQAARKMARTAVEPLPEVPVEPEVPEVGKDEAWDYEKLFDEGDEERRQMQYRKTEMRLREARRRRRAQVRPDSALESEEAQEAAFAALHALELYSSSGAPEEEWILFLHSGTFLNAQHNADFIFGLEDFLNEHPWLPDSVRRHIYLTYKFYNGKPGEIYMGLYRLLKTCGGRAANGQRVKIPWRKRVFRQERAPLILLWLLLSCIFIDCFFLNAAVPKGPDPGSASISNTAVPSAADSHTIDELPDETQQGIGAVRNLAIYLAAQDYPGIYALTNAGLSENGGAQYYWAQCTGQEESGETLVMNYFLSEDGTQVFCLSDEQNTGTIYAEPVGTTAANGKTVTIYRCPE